MKQFFTVLARRLFMASAALVVASCSTVPTGPERLARVDQLVTAQEFARAEVLLADLDARDPAFDELLLRRRALRPLIAQYEENTINKIAQLKRSDEWPAAESLIEDALDKLPRSEILLAAEDAFYRERADRLTEIEREIRLLKGEHLIRKASLVAEAGAVHPDGLSTRWQRFRHEQETQQMAEDLAKCGESALAEARYDLAESCLKMASTLAQDADTSSRLALLEQRRTEEAAAAARQAAAERRAEKAARIARETEALDELKIRYRSMMDAGWWGAAKEILAELQSQLPRDDQVVAWGEELSLAINQQVTADIERGQSLYSRGQLHEALAIWRDAARLDPQNDILQAHIARVERFLAKLERLDEEV